MIDTGRIEDRRALRFEGQLSAGTPRVPIRLGHPSSSVTLPYFAHFDLHVSALAIPASAARALNLALIHDLDGVVRTQISYLFEREGMLYVGECSAIVLADNVTSPPEVAIGRELLRRSTLHVDGPGDRWSWVFPS